MRIDQKHDEPQKITRNNCCTDVFDVFFSLRLVGIWDFSGTSLLHLAHQIPMPQKTHLNHIQGVQSESQLLRWCLESEKGRFKFFKHHGNPPVPK